jgi:hypothetical protein
MPAGGDHPDPVDTGPPGSTRRRPWSVRSRAAARDHRRPPRRVHPAPTDRRRSAVRRTRCPESAADAAAGCRGRARRRLLAPTSRSSVRPTYAPPPRGPARLHPGSGVRWRPASHRRCRGRSTGNGRTSASAGSSHGQRRPPDWRTSAAAGPGRPGRRSSDSPCCSARGPDRPSRTRARDHSSPRARSSGSRLVGWTRHAGPARPMLRPPRLRLPR